MTALSWAEIEDRAVGFRKAWEKQKGAERQQAQNFIREFLDCFGMDARTEASSLDIYTNLVVGCFDTLTQRTGKR